MDIKNIHRAAQHQLYKFKYFENLQEISLEEKLNNFFYFEFFNEQYLLINDDSCMSHIFVFNSTMALFQPLQFQIVTGPIDQVVPVVPQTSTYLVTRGMTDQCLIGGTSIWELKDNVLKVRKNKGALHTYIHRIFSSPKNFHYHSLLKIFKKCFRHSVKFCVTLNIYLY